MGNGQGRPVVLTNEVQLDHFKLLRVVGKGAFGKVRIVERKDTGLTFALKYIRKDEVVRSENVRNIIRERRMLEQLNHPFLCNLRYSFQDFEYLYLVVDLMHGGDLRFHITRKTFTEDTVRFWMAELGCALRYIHQQGIVHRDVKPDNVLLDSDGHVHLADFNVAAEVSPNKLLSSKSGTLAYLAPEVCAGFSYSWEVDWWSLGVTFYECVYNKRPFHSKDQDILMTQIRQADVKYPLTNPPVSTACSAAMQKLLDKKPYNRIGVSSFESFAKHPFFLPIDFVALENKSITPPFRPSSQKTNFDATYDLEELLLEEAPLEARVRHQKARQQLKANATPQEERTDELHKMIETLFQPFDYTLTAYDKQAEANGDRLRPISTFPTSSGVIPPRNDSLGAHLVLSQSAASLSGSPPLSSQVSLRTLPTLPSLPNLRGTSSATPSHRPTHLPRTNRMSGRLEEFNSAQSDQSGTETQAYSLTSMTRDSRAKSTGKPSGFLGFLSRKTRKRSPLTGPPENGVLGREGARVVIDEG